eukprot:7196873-Heterocapsa_arctica.AAC.1
MSTPASWSGRSNSTPLPPGTSPSSDGRRAAKAAYQGAPSPGCEEGGIPGSSPKGTLCASGR